MIDLLTGKVAAEAEDYLVVMVGGVGIRVYATRTARQNIENDLIYLFTHLIVREDALTLYGFADGEERDIFEILLTVSGVGPRLALMILNTLSREHLQNAVVREEPDILTRVPGIGKKTAQKIVFELKDKISRKLGQQPMPLISAVDEDVIAALTALGYSIIEAQTALQSIPRDAPNDVGERIRLALQYFAS